MDDLRMEKIMSLLDDDDYTPMKPREIAFLMNVPKSEHMLFEQAVGGLISEGGAFLTKKGRLTSVKKSGLTYGTFSGSAKGFGFVSSERLADDAYVPTEAVNGAMSGDKVLFRITQRGGRRQEAEIVSVLERGRGVIVGTFEKRKNGGRVIADDRKIAGEIYIAGEDCKGAMTGHKVTVALCEPVKGAPPRGRIMEILGHKNDPGVDILSIVAQYEIPAEFPDEVYAQAERIPDAVSEADIKGRRDFRDKLIITIDGPDAKDLDDAVSLEALENGIYRLGVHIADVSHYVKPGSPLHKEAFRRGTSVYLVDRVIPMLPHRLSNGICSLNPREDRLTLSCIMDIDASGTVVSSEICESVINTAARMTYDDVSEIVSGGNTELREAYAHIAPMLDMMNVLREVLRANRIRRGAIEFDFAECKIILDSNGVPVDIRPYYRNDATSLIEEFMLICNETVAERFYWLEAPFVYRTHEAPDPEKVAYLSKFVRQFGHSLKGSKAFTKSVQGLLMNVRDTPEETIINRVVLRSMKQARYTADNAGHFGLSAKYYCHFTSPIRRFPDLQIHEIIKSVINGTMDAGKTDALNKALPDICKRCCITERTAEEAEREADNLKKAEYMRNKVGQEFDGVISGVTNWGIYVELPNTVEGMVSLADLEDDYYIFEEENLLCRGERTGRTYRLGDRVRVMVVKVNLDIRKVDFVMVNPE